MRPCLSVRCIMRTPRGMKRSALVLSVGAEIRRLRKERGLTLNEFAAMLPGYTRSGLSRIETGTASPSFEGLEVIAAAFGKRLHVEIR